MNEDVMHTKDTKNTKVSPCGPDPPAGSAAQPPLSLQGQQCFLEPLARHDVQQRVQAAAHAAHSLKKLIGGMEDVAVLRRHLLVDPHEHQGGDHDVVRQEGHNKDQQGGSDEPQRLPHSPPTSRQTPQHPNRQDVECQHGAKRQQEADRGPDDGDGLDVGQRSTDVVHAHSSILWSLDGKSHK